MKKRKAARKNFSRAKIRKSRKTRPWFGLIIVLAAVIIAVIVSTKPDDPNTIYRCDDSDRGNPFEFGSVHDWRSQQSVNDRCADANTLHELDCDYTLQEPRGKVVLATYSCACNYGRCLVPDMEVTDVSISKAPETNEEFRVSFRVKNNGDIPVSTIDLTVFFEPGYGILIEAPQEALQPGQTADFTYSVQYNVPGAFRVISVLDPYGYVTEKDEFNNERVDIIQVS